jgi:hypothetical protein
MILSYPTKVTIGKDTVIQGRGCVKAGEVVSVDKADYEALKAYGKLAGSDEKKGGK